MKSLYDILQESLLDDEDVIISDTDNKIYGEVLLKNIMGTKSFEDYERQIATLNELLKDNTELVSKGDKRFTKFEKDSIYLILLHVTSNRTMEHSTMYIGNGGDNITYMITAHEARAVEYNRVVNVESDRNIKLYYKNLYDYANIWKTIANLYIYKIDGTKFEGLLKSAADLGNQTKYFNKIK